MVKHIGIVACSAEGAALCYRTICAEAEALTVNLVAEHEKGEELTRGMATVIGNVAQGAEIPRHLFERLAREYLDFNRRHMEMEEAEFLPLAEAALSAEDWAAIEAALSAPEDPLFGAPGEERFAALRQDILCWAQEARAQEAR